MTVCAGPADRSAEAIRWHNGAAALRFNASLAGLMQLRAQSWDLGDRSSDAIREKPDVKSDHLLVLLSIFSSQLSTASFRLGKSRISMIGLGGKVG